MEEGYVRSCTESDINYLAPLLRDIDKEEIGLSEFADATEALTVGMEESILCFTILSPKTRLPMAMFGVVEKELNNAPYNVVWLLGTQEIEKHSRKFLRYSRRWVDVLVRSCGTIGNVVLAKNHTSIRWLEWCGFETDFISYAPDGQLLISYVKIKEAC